MKKILLVFIIVLSFCVRVFSATGCYYTSGNIYIKPGGSGGAGVPNYTYSTTADRVSASSYCMVTAGGANSCFINGTSPTVYGVLVNYSAMPCSIDNEIYIFMTAIAGFSYFLLKKGQVFI